MPSFPHVAEAAWPSAWLLDSPVDEGVDDGWVGEGAGVAEVAGVALGDLAQDAAHDFSAACFG